MVLHLAGDRLKQNTRQMVKKKSRSTFLRSSNMQGKHTKDCRATQCKVSSDLIEHLKEALLVFTLQVRVVGLKLAEYPANKL